MKNRLRVLRAERRFTQRGVARKIKIGTYRFWQIENDYIDPAPDEQERLARLFNVPILDIFPADEARAS
jgi:transcriptional regulator with XRE-family HTH domain